MPDHPILETVERLRAARKLEQEALYAAADARALLEHARVIVLADGYTGGQIDGKNAEARKIQEAQLLAASEVVRKAEADYRLAESKHDADRIERQYHEDRFNALRVLLEVGVAPS